MSRWLREPLIHFLLLGAVIFAVYNQVAGRGSAPGEIFTARHFQPELLARVLQVGRGHQRVASLERFDEGVPGAASLSAAKGQDDNAAVFGEGKRGNEGK